jgi:hypothetical protein
VAVLAALVAGDLSTGCETPDAGPTCGERAEAINQFEAENDTCARDLDCTVYWMPRVEGRECSVLVNVSAEASALDTLVDRYGDCTRSCHPIVCPCTWLSWAVCELGHCQEAEPCYEEDAYPQVVYEGQPDGCAAGYNCFGATSLQEPIRVSPLEHCRSLDEVVTCSLVTDQLMSQPDLTCREAEPGTRCQVGDLPDGSVADASLIGVCAPSTPASLAVYAACDASAPEACPPGTTCAPEDGLGLGPLRCVPWCDVLHHDGVQATCVDLGAPAETACVSVGVIPGPDEPSRLGRCVR